MKFPVFFSSQPYFSSESYLSSFGFIFFFSVVFLMNLAMALVICCYCRSFIYLSISPFLLLLALRVSASFLTLCSGSLPYQQWIRIVYCSSILWFAFGSSLFKLWLEWEGYFCARMAVDGTLRCRCLPLWPRAVAFGCAVLCSVSFCCVKLLCCVRLKYAALWCFMLSFVTCCSAISLYSFILCYDLLHNTVL